MIGLPAMVYPSGSKSSRPLQVALLEDPDERPEARRERQQGHHHGLDRDRNRPEQQEQDDRRGEQRGTDGPRDPLGLAHQEVLADGRAAAHLHPRERRVEGNASDLGDHVSRGGRGRVVRADRVDADGRAAKVGLAQLREPGLELRWQRTRRRGVELRDLRRRQRLAGAGVADRERALHPLDALERRQAIGQRGDGDDRVLARGIAGRVERG